VVNSTTHGVQNLVLYNSEQTLLIHNAYWMGYVLGPVCFGYWVLTRVGFKATFMTGLAIFTVASLSFWWLCFLISFPGFVVSNLFIGSGLSVLEVAANPFIALAGPDELMESRLNFAQGMQAVGVVVSPLIAVEVMFKNGGRAGLFNSQWVYLAAALWTSFLGVVFYYVPLSEASDEDLEKAAVLRESRLGLNPDARVLGINILWFTASLWILFMFLYLGAKEQLLFGWDGLIPEMVTG
jgi:fucose permease